MYALAIVVVLAGTAGAEPLDQIIRDRIAPALPDGLDVAKVHLSTQLARLDLEPDHVGVELPHELRAGRSSIRLLVRGRPAQFVPVTLAPLAEVAVVQHALAPGSVIAESDIAIEQRAIAGSGSAGPRRTPDGSAPAPAATVVGATATRPLGIGAIILRGDVTLPPPLARGTQVTVEIRRGGARIRGEGTLELNARVGETAAVRLTQTRAIVRGTLVAPSTVVVGEP